MRMVTSKLMIRLPLTLTKLGKSKIYDLPQLHHLL
jgi:hypothetical protein